MASSLSLHSLHLLFCWVLSILALIWLVLMALSCAAIRRDSVSLLKFSFLSQVHVLSCEILFISRLKCPWSCFPYHFCFLIIIVVLFISFVSGGCNESSFVFLYIVFESLYGCVNAVCNAGNSSSSLFSCPLIVFRPSLADGITMDFEWQQVSPGLQDSSQYSSRSE